MSDSQPIQTLGLGINGFKKQKDFELTSMCDIFASSF